MMVGIKDDNWGIFCDAQDDSDFGDFGLPRKLAMTVEGEFCLNLFVKLSIEPADSEFFLEIIGVKLTSH